MIEVSGSLNLTDLPFPGSSPLRVLNTSPTVVPNTFMFCFSAVLRGASSIAWIASVIGLYTRIFVVVTGSIKATGFPLPGSSPFKVLWISAKPPNIFAFYFSET